MEKPILAAILSCSGTKLTDSEKYLFSKYNPLGVSLFSCNMKTFEQTQKLVSEIKEVIGREDVLIGIDQEGGRVSRLNNIVNYKYASEATLGEVPEIYTTYHAQLISADIRHLGINVNFAPVLDVAEKNQSKVLEKRCFSTDKKRVVSYGKAMADSYIENAICPCIKHIPGHFSAKEDPHLELATINLKQKHIEDYITYLQAFKKYPLAMTSHIFMPKVDAQYPATQSKIIISEIIRKYLSFDGFLLSDAIEMNALKGTISEKVNTSLDAGIDAVLCCSGKYSDLETVCRQERILTEKSLIRFAKIKKVFHNIPKHIDIENIRGQYEAELKDKLHEKYSYDATEILKQMHKKGEN